MTNQEIFNTVRDHLLKQGAKAVDDGSLNCRYLTREGRQCAVGVLIKPEHYRSTFEGMSIGSHCCHEADELRTAVAKSLGMESLPGDTLNLLSALQLVHDKREVEHWPSQLKEVANRFGLAA